jgi:hypothetical protein
MVFREILLDDGNKVKIDLAHATYCTYGAGDPPSRPIRPGEALQLVLAQREPYRSRGLADLRDLRAAARAWHRRSHTR